MICVLCIWKQALVSLNSVICDLLSQLSPQFTIDVDCERDYAKILSLFQSDKEEHSIAKQHPELVAEWHPTKNGATTPSMVSDGVNSKVWWLCEKGHEYMCSPYNRKNGVGCPICCNKKIVQGVNDIRSTAPESLSEWDFEKNKTEGIYPEQCSTGSEKRVWWICAKCNYSYQMVIYHKFAGHGCPQCAKEHIRRAKFKKVINIDTKEIYESITHAEKATNISRHCISNCCKGKQNKAGGYHWAYIESDEQKSKNE